MANYPSELAQDAGYQSHTGRLTGLWFLPKLVQGLNITITTTTTTTTTNNNNNNNNFLRYENCI
jgi:hypothetical protein